MLENIAIGKFCHFNEFTTTSFKTKMAPTNPLLKYDFLSNYKTFVFSASENYICITYVTNVNVQYIMILIEFKIYR